MASRYPSIQATETGYVVTINNRFTPWKAWKSQVQPKDILEKAYHSLPRSARMDATTPITYTWEATGLPPVQHVGDSTG